MSETPEQTLAKFIDQHLRPGAQDYAHTVAHAEATEAREALASLRQRQEELERERVGANAVGDALRGLNTSLRTQLQQAEQEVERRKQRSIEDTGTLIKAGVEAAALQRQLQQAETALASFREAAERTLQDIHNGEANSTGARMLDAALAAPPPNTKETT